MSKPEQGALSYSYLRREGGPTTEGNMKQINVLTTLMLALGLAACGGEERPSGTNPGPNPGTNPNPGGEPRGFTSCGSVTCQPGQYCYDEILLDCRNGCLSDLNCTDNQVCDKGSADEGVCQNVSTPNPGPGPGPAPTDEIARCKTGCEEAQACGLFDVATTVECTAACGVLSDPQAKALADCVENQGCGSGLPGCYNLECGPSYSCGVGQECIGGICL